MGRGEEKETLSKAWSILDYARNLRLVRSCDFYGGLQ